jgi:hemolysin D
MSRIEESALTYQDPLDRIMAGRPPLGLRLWPALAGLLLVILLALAGISRLDVVVTAPGRLATAAAPVVMKPMTAGVLRDMLVHPGEVVVAGQLLARIDATFPAADLAAVEAQYRSATATIARIEAELAGRRLPVQSDETALQAEVMSQRAEVDAAEADSWQARVRAAGAALHDENLVGDSLRARLHLVREVEVMRRKLAARATGTALAVMEAEGARLAAEAELARHEARLDQLTEALAASEAEALAHQLDRRRILLEELAAARPRLAALAEELAKARALSAGTELHAPRPGVVLTTAAGGVGSLVSTGEAVVTLVPTDVPLIAEVNLRSADAGQVAPGDPVTIKVDAFPWRRHGTLTGTLEELSQASVTPEGSAVALHAARARLDPDLLSLSGMAPGTRLLPGMTLVAEVQVGTRSILEYFLDPLIRGLEESLREP